MSASNVAQLDDKRKQRHRHDLGMLRKVGEDYWDRLIRLVEERAWESFGDRDWVSFYRGRVADLGVKLDMDARSDVVWKLAQAGLPQTAIAQTIGWSQAQVNNELRKAEESGVIRIDNANRKDSLGRRNTGRPRKKPEPVETKNDPAAEQEVVSFFAGLVKQTFTEKNMATLLPETKDRLAKLLRLALETLEEKS